MDRWLSETCRTKHWKIKIICKNLCIFLVYLHIAIWCTAHTASNQYRFWNYWKLRILDYELRVMRLLQYISKFLFWSISTQALFTGKQSFTKNLSCILTHSCGKNPALIFILFCEILGLVIAFYCNIAASRAFNGTNIYFGINSNCLWSAWLTRNSFTFPGKREEQYCSTLHRTHKAPHENRTANRCLPGVNCGLRFQKYLRLFWIFCTFRSLIICKCHLPLLDYKMKKVT